MVSRCKDSQRQSALPTHPMLCKTILTLTGSGPATVGAYDSSRSQNLLHAAVPTAHVPRPILVGTVFAHQAEHIFDMEPREPSGPHQAVPDLVNVGTR